ncbi:hypothetical protein SprV_0100338100 [Sparganum proliferum]
MLMLRWQNRIVNQEDLELTGLKKSSGDCRSNMRSKSDRHCQSQTDGSQVTRAYDPQRQCPHCQRTLSARIGFVEHLRKQCYNNPTKSTSVNTTTVTPVSNPTTTSTPTTGDHTADVPLPSITGPIISAPAPASITATGFTSIITSPTPTTNETTSETPSATIFTTSAPPPAMGTRSQPGRSLASPSNCDHCTSVLTPNIYPS